MCLIGTPTFPNAFNKENVQWRLVLFSVTFRTLFAIIINTKNAIKVQNNRTFVAVHLSGPGQRCLVPRALHKKRHRLGGDGAQLRRRPGAHSEPTEVSRQPRAGVRVRRHLRSG